MDRYIVFTEKTQSIIDEAFELAFKIWGYEVNFNEVRVIAGNYSGYGKYLARYHPDVKLIEIPLGNYLSYLILTNNGIEIRQNNMTELKGMILHELGHFFVENNSKKPWDGVIAGHTTHKKPSWCWICAKGWSYFNKGKLNISTELIAYGVRKSQEFKNLKCMESFNPYNIPYKLLETIEKEMIEKTRVKCVQCEEIFTRQTIRRIYCSDKCKMAYTRKMKK